MENTSIPSYKEFLILNNYLDKESTITEDQAKQLFHKIQVGMLDGMED